MIHELQTKACACIKAAGYARAARRKTQAPSISSNN